MPDKVLHKCEDCGFLAMRQKASRELREAERASDGSLRVVLDKEHPRYPDADSEIYESPPICLKGVRDFRRPDVAYPAIGRGGHDWSAIREEWDSHECFTEHRWGLTPKEHREMLDRQWMAEREHEWRTQDLKAQERIEQTARDAAKDNKLAARAQAASVIVAAIAIAVSVIVSQCSGGNSISSASNIPPPIVTPRSP